MDPARTASYSFAYLTPTCARCVNDAGHSPRPWARHSTCNGLTSVSVAFRREPVRGTRANDALVNACARGHGTVPVDCRCSPGLALNHPLPLLRRSHRHDVRHRGLGYGFACAQSASRNAIRTGVPVRRRHATGTTFGDTKANKLRRILTAAKNWRAAATIPPLRAARVLGLCDPATVVAALRGAYRRDCWVCWSQRRCTSDCVQLGRDADASRQDAMDRTRGASKGDADTDAGTSVAASADLDGDRESVATGMSGSGVDDGHEAADGGDDAPKPHKLVVTTQPPDQWYNQARGRQDTITVKARLVGPDHPALYHMDRLPLTLTLL